MADSEPNSAPRVLIVDDEAVCRAVNSLRLRQMGCRVECCSDAESAQTVLREHPDRFDLVVTDLQMPGLDGGQLVRWVHEHLPQLPVIVLSGALDGALCQELRSWTVACLEKPVCERVFERTLLEAIA